VFTKARATARAFAYRGRRRGKSKLAKPAGAT